ncbi:endo-1,4-beta-xylanase [Treponema sp. R6D11]
MIKKTVVFVLIILMFGLSGCKSASEPDPETKQASESPIWPPATESENIWNWPAETTGEKLYTAWSFPLGVAVPGANTSNSSNNNALDTSNPQYPLLKHFNVVVAENEMKPANIMPSSASAAYGRMTNADKLVSYAKAMNKRIRGHVLIWHSQTPSWFFPSTSLSGAERKAKLYENMEKHIKAVFEHFGGTIDSWDVCNEVVDQSTFTNGGARTDSNYTKIMEAAGLTGINRYEYVVKAFEWARKYADKYGGENVKLFITDVGIERRFPDAVEGQKSKIDAFEDLVNYLILKNAPFDGVGFQGHFRLYDHPVEQISAGIDRFAAKEIKPGKNIIIQVCELDFSVFSNAEGEGNATTIDNSLLNTRLTDLANNYLDFFNMFEQKYKEGKLDMVLIWGIDDGHSWLNGHPVSGRTDYPLLFDRNYQAKKAFEKLRNGPTEP